LEPDIKLNKIPIRKGKELSMSSSTRFEEDHELWGLLLQARDLLFKIRKNELQSQEIMPQEGHILHIIDSAGYKATPTSISRQLFLTCHSISERLSRIERKGLIRRVWDMDNKSSVRVEITEKGREIYNRSRELDSVREVMSVLSDEEHKLLRQALQKIVDKSIERLKTAC
jgi:DNA-binding MarR family transcriptional regulator